MSHKFDRSCFGGGLIDTFTIIHNSGSGLTKQPPGQARTILSVAGKVDIVVWASVHIMWRLCGASNQLFMPFQGQNGVLELSIQGHEDVFEVQYWNCFNLILKSDLVFVCRSPLPLWSRVASSWSASRTTRSLTRRKSRSWSSRSWPRRLGPATWPPPLMCWSASSMSMTILHSSANQSTGGEDKFGKCKMFTRQG